MAIHSDFDHQLKIGATTESFRLVLDENKAPMYRIENFVPQYRDPLTFTQRDWKGGHGQYSMRVPDKYFEGQAIDTTQDGRVFLGPAITTVLEADDTALDTAPVKFIWFPAVSKWLCATSGKIYLYGTKWTAAATAVAGVTDLCIFGAYIFAACGASTAYKYSADGDTWTTSNLADPYATYFFVAPNSAGTAEVLWKAVTNELKSNTSGINGGAAWSSAAYIGDASTNITNIFLSGDKLLIGKTDGLWHYDSDGGLHQLRPDLDQNKSTDNFKYVTWWSAGIYHSEINGMGEILTNDNYDPMGPLKDIGNTGKRGDIVGLTADREFSYVAIDEGTNTIIYKGREIYREGIGLRWEWCPFAFLGVYTCATIATNQHSTTDRRLWFGYTTGATYATAYVILSDNPTADSAYRFTTSGFVRMSYDYGSDARWDKLWQSAVLEVKGGASGETVQIKYRKDTDTSATECIAAATTNGVYESNFSAELACKRIQFEIHLASDTNTATPEVSYFQAKGVEKPTTTRIHEAVYVIGDEPSTRAKTLRDLLRTARTSTSLIRFADLRYDGTTGGTAGTDFVYVIVEPGYPQEVEIFHRDKGSTPEMGLRVRLREVSYS